MSESPTPFLPMRDPNPRHRRVLLGASRAQYQLTETRVRGIPMVAEVPESETFGDAYWNLRNDLDKLVRNQNQLGPLLGQQKPLTLAQHAALFPVLDDPSSIQRWEFDSYFAEQRLSGPNPLSLTRVPASGLEEPCHITNERVADLLPEGDSLESLAAAGSLFQLDFMRLLKGAPAPARGGTDSGFGLPRPIALFAFLEKTGTFSPIAIQVSPELHRIFTPKSNSQHWLLAKLCVQVADANYHQLFWHLGRTHLVLERFAAAAGRTLAPNHPIRILLDAHLHYVLAINREATNNLIPPGGPVDQLFAGSLEDSLAIARHGALSFDATASALPTSLENRGVDKLPNFAFGEDARLIWDATRCYVQKYLGLYYQQSGDNPPSRDTELRAFLHSLATECKIQGISRYAGVRLDELAELITTVIFTSSATHAAVNYPQFDYQGFSPNMPLAVYDDRERFFRMPTPNRGDLETFLKTYLPPSRSAALQVELTHTLSHFRYDRLGEYDRRLVDARARHLQLEFQSDLRLAEAEITRRNESRTWPYLYLLPSQIPNSTSL